MTKVKCPLCDTEIPVPKGKTRTEALLQHIYEKHPTDGIAKEEKK